MRASRDELEAPRCWGELSVSTRDVHGQDHGSDHVCGLPHWGYVVAGRLRIAYPDHEEVVSAGDAYYVAPGHLGVLVVDGAQLVQFSRTEAG